MKPVPAKAGACSQRRLHPLLYMPSIFFVDVNLCQEVLGQVYLLKTYAMPVLPANRASVSHTARQILLRCAYFQNMESLSN